MRLFLIAFIGPVGSGKTHVARIVARRIGAVHIRTDDIRVLLRKKGKPYSRAPLIAKQMAQKAFCSGKSVVLDFDAVRPQRQKELVRFAKQFGAGTLFIRVLTPERLILKRLREHRYSRKDLFQSAEEAIRVHYLRRALHRKKKKLQLKPGFVINNARSLLPQINKVVKKLRK
ncbi:MAG: ATP-binding protein [Candidatus Sungbacteria bacterium]|nr:ATP-binding protein [Candidatus Sungbacteria bacterium]